MLYAEKSMQPSTIKSIRKRGRLIGAILAKRWNLSRRLKKKKKNAMLELSKEKMAFHIEER